MSQTSLDDDTVYEKLDPDGLIGRIAALPDQIDEAWRAARALALPGAYAGAKRIAVLGMGGSGIGGAMLRALALDLGARTPIDVVHGYRLPAHIDAQTLVLGSSNSGDTEEVISSFAAAIERQAMCVAVTGGGRIASIARDAGVPLLEVQWTHEPRAAVGWSFASLLAICGKLALVPDLADELPAALDAMRAMGAACGREAPEASNPAKQLARRLSGKLPVFVGAETLAPVAYRWRTQVNENAKSWAIADELPEMNHNAHAGYGLPKRTVPLLHAVLLRHASAHPRVALRFDATADEMRRNGVEVEILEINGVTLLAQVLRAVQLGDYVSYYLGLLNGVEPSPVEPLVRLKQLLAEKE
jgi:glucose/mannose-6-phosphate isomerase